MYHSGNCISHIGSKQKNIWLVHCGNLLYLFVLFDISRIFGLAISPDVHSLMFLLACTCDALRDLAVLPGKINLKYYQ